MNMDELKEEVKDDFLLVCEANGWSFSDNEVDEIVDFNIERYQSHIEECSEISEFNYITKKEIKVREDIKMCGCTEHISLGCSVAEFIADEEPYKNGVFEDVSSEDEAIIDCISFYVSATICKKCMKVYFLDENGKNLGIEDV